jgi:hypothetical protein
MILKTLKTKSALSYFGSDSESAADLAAMLNHCANVLSDVLAEWETKNGRLPRQE